MNILILEDEPRNAKRLIRLLNDIDRTFIVPVASGIRVKNEWILFRFTG